ncbi:hypothetical protein ALC60_09487 [Trachymyrmex zeteki]|uniref:Uncharacterized protein n=1 Tax=Mycetomoellerius zeteki TaxID=64791 RepID=A0A151WU94_9HYME|nr:hypothetical protein ALC60_09487 [Trachymyrmex zeteki]
MKTEQTTSTNVIQPVVLPKPYMVTIKISPSNKCGKADAYVIDAMIDLVSPISLIHNSIVRDDGCDPVSEDTSQFCGINGSRLKILNEHKYNLRRKADREYKIGDYVEIRNIETAPGVNKKLLPKFKGPYLVKAILDMSSLMLMDSN